MPETPNPKLRPHPWSGAQLTGAVDVRAPRRSPGAASAYAELAVTSNFTFLTGASHPEELVQRASELGYRALAITDENSLAGIVRAHVAAREAGIGLVVGCRLELGLPAGLRPVPHPPLPPPPEPRTPQRATAPKGGAPRETISVLVYPTDRASYGRLCRLLTLGKRRAPKGECHLRLDDLCAHAEGLLAAFAFAGPATAADTTSIQALRTLREAFDQDRLSIAASRAWGPDDRGWWARLEQLSSEVEVPLVATNDVHYHVPERRPLQDVLTCVRHGCTIDAAGFRLFAHGERYLRPPGEIERLFSRHRRALERSTEIAERALGFQLDELSYQYPDEICVPGRSPMAHLVQLTWAGARQRYPGGVPAAVRERIEREFRLIDELDYAPYFLTVYDFVLFARSRGILCQGRGAAANSAVCYCLGVTAVDPDRIDLLFERFISKERDEPPDIDIDFEHERREEVIQYIYEKYGRERAALTAEVITYRGRSAVRDVGKALGLSLDCVDRLAKDIDWWQDGVGRRERLEEMGLDPEDPTLRRVLALSRELLGFPRHLSQHVGGFVITQEPLCELVPIENAAMPERTVIEWDKDDIDAMGMLKVDVLGLGMLTCVRKAFDLIQGDRERSGTAALPSSLSLHSIPPEDSAVYDMICKADTIGVFQIESRAQMTMLPRLRPRSFYDLVIEVAIVRPGPIQGDMVHPYLKRRNDEEEVTFPKEEVRRVLEKTLGVPLFQEQAMALAIVAAGFTPGEADGLRRAMAAWKRKGDLMEQYGERLVAGMLERGYPREFAERCLRQMRGFSEYGFPESHAASFALIVYVSAWLKHHHPAAFAAALINSQPMGFYAPAQIVRDAEEHGVEVRAVDVNASAWDCTLERGERGLALRLGMRLVKGLREAEARGIAAAVAERGPFPSIDDLKGASGARAKSLERLASADAFRSMGFDRQTALWHVRALRDEELSLFAGLRPDELPPDESPKRPALPPFSPQKEVLHDYASLHLSLKAHPVCFLRARLERCGALEARRIQDGRSSPHGTKASVAGLVLVRQRPATARGLIFMTLEDETGIANLVIHPPVYERCRSAAKHGMVVLARGHVERQGEVVHLVVWEMESLDPWMRALVARSRDFH